MSELIGHIVITVESGVYNQAYTQILRVTEEVRNAINKSRNFKSLWDYYNKSVAPTLVGPKTAYKLEYHPLESKKKKWNNEKDNVGLPSSSQSSQKIVILKRDERLNEPSKLWEDLPIPTSQSSSPATRTITRALQS